MARRKTHDEEKKPEGAIVPVQAPKVAEKKTIIVVFNPKMICPPTGYPVNLGDITKTKATLTMFRKFQPVEVDPKHPNVIKLLACGTLVRVED